VRQRAKTADDIVLTSSYCG